MESPMRITKSVRGRSMLKIMALQWVGSGGIVFSYFGLGKANHSA
jgi:hypothetical protein